jgi:hypothetical protein
MADSIGPALPASRVAQLGPGSAPDRALVLPLCTVDDAGFPHVALLGAWEVTVADTSALRFAIGGGSRSAANLRRSGRATLLIVDEAAAHYVKLRVTEASGAMRAAPWNARFDASVVDVLEDATHPEREGTSHLVSGIRCVTDPACEPARAAVLAELRSS